MHPGTRRLSDRVRPGSWSPKRNGRCATRPARFPSPAGPARRGWRGGPARMLPAPRAARGIRRGWRRLRAENQDAAATQPGSNTYEAFYLALQPQLRGFTLEQRIEGLVVLHAFVDLHA